MIRLNSKTLLFMLFISINPYLQSADKYQKKDKKSNNQNIILYRGPASDLQELTFNLLNKVEKKDLQRIKKLFPGFKKVKDDESAVTSFLNELIDDQEIYCFYYYLVDTLTISKSTDISSIEGFLNKLEKAINGKDIESKKS